MRYLVRCFHFRNTVLHINMYNFGYSIMNMLSEYSVDDVELNIYEYMLKYELVSINC